jgi:16S rRNA (uracil1498-N3)-methyltransferase
MADRYFVETPIESNTAVLEGAEMHHLVHVMRAGVGTEVVLFDGSRFEFIAQITRISKNRVELNVVSRQMVDRELPVFLVLAVALPKGDRQKWLVEKAVELGVQGLVPLKTTRGVAQPVEQAIHRLRRSVIEASKQCGRNVLMGIGSPQTWDELIEETRNYNYRLLADATGVPLAQCAVTASPGIPLVPRRSVVAIGPEGGFTADEVSKAAAAGWSVVSLGARTLRVETAAILAAAMLIVRNNWI